MEINKKAYEAYVKEVTPVHKKWPSIIKAFLVGGIICTLGQISTNLFINGGMEKEAASAWTTLILIASSVILTGLNIYPKIVKFGGAGALVPITGFANSVVAPAVEFKSEGQIFGIGCKIFTIAGPVILYGILSSWILGVIAYVLMAFGIL
jgi:stage V sporulation protein AC